MSKRFLPPKAVWTATALALCLAAVPPAHGGQKKRPTPPADAPEWVIRLCDIVLARNVGGGGDSPLARSKSRLGWAWLAARHGVPADGRIDRKGFRGPKELFDRLDRDGDGALDAGDFDWSEQSSFLRQQALARGLFNRLNPDGDGLITAREWQEAFAQLSAGKPGLNPDDLRQLLFPRQTRSMTPPSRWHRLLGFLSGELGSFNEGPDPGEEAPDFALSTPDNKTLVRLSAFRNSRPVVLIFGNFT